MDKSTENKLFKEICLAYPISSPSGWLASKAGISQERASEILLSWIVTNRCRRCDAALSEVVVGSTYWSAKKQPFCSDTCKRLDEVECVYECQKIDANCNECVHFKREELQKVPGIPGGVWHGQCLKKGVPTEGISRWYQGHECFEHRKDV